MLTQPQLMDGANVQLWSADNVDQQKFTLEYNDGGIDIRIEQCISKHRSKSK